MASRRGLRSRDRLVAVRSWLLCLSLTRSDRRQRRTNRGAVICAPELKIEPTWTIENLAGQPEIEADGQTWTARTRNRSSS